MISGAVAAWSWCMANKALLLKLAPWLLCVAIGVWGGFEHFGWEACSAAAARRDKAEQQAVLEQKEKDRVLGNKLVDQQLAANERTDQQGRQTIEVIRNVPVTMDCSRSPAMRAAHDGLRQLGFPEGPRPAADGAAQGAAAPAARPRRRIGQRDRGGAHAPRRGVHQARGAARSADLLRRAVQAGRDDDNHFRGA